VNSQQAVRSLIREIFDKPYPYKKIPVEGTHAYGFGTEKGHPYQVEIDHINQNRGYISFLTKTVSLPRVLAAVALLFSIFGIPQSAHIRMHGQ
jgi:hypothetical protein